MVTVSSKHRKPILLKDQPSLEQSFIIKGDDIASNSPWHFHPEVEIIYCTKAKGTNFIGNYVSPIEEGELLLIGKNLTHARKPDNEYYLQNPEDKPESIVVKFRENFLGDDFFSINEFSHIETLFQRAQRGMKFNGETREHVGFMLKKMVRSSSIFALLEIISILDVLGMSDNFIFLNQVNFLSEANNHDSEKINKVFEYTGSHFREPVTLSDVAKLVNLTEGGFCRYFKTRTGKSYFQYLTEVRIANACRMLLEDDKDVAQVCYSNGFNNPSNFHKQFKKIVNLTPKEYRGKGQDRVGLDG